MIAKISCILYQRWNSFVINLVWSFIEYDSIDMFKNQNVHFDRAYIIVMIIIVVYLFFLL